MLLDNGCLTWVESFNVYKDNYMILINVIIQVNNNMIEFIIYGLLVYDI